MCRVAMAQTTTEMQQLLMNDMRRIADTLKEDAWRYKSIAEITGLSHQGQGDN